MNGLCYAPLFSGSSGNSVFVGCGETRLLVDAGLSGRPILDALETIGVPAGTINAILITHDHIDHIKGAGVLSRKLHVPVYATVPCWDAIGTRLGRIETQFVRVFEPGESFFVGDIEVTGFPTPHDAPGSVGYAFQAGGARFCVATDLGCIRDTWMNYVLGADAVLLEANYDPNMLTAGPYPYDLKRRIASRSGHLSNEDAGAAAVRIVRAGASQIILGHLSKENNFPDLAYETVSSVLGESGITPGEDVDLRVALRDAPTGLFSLETQI